jgi:Phosphotransferase enzyme family
VRWPDGHLGVLTWSPPLPPGQPGGAFERSMRFMDTASAAGIPLPRYEAVIPIGGLGIAVLQERVEGRSPQVVTARLVDHVLELTELRRGLLLGTPDADSRMALYLTAPGPGFCLHEPLEKFDRRTRALLDVIKGVVSSGSDYINGSDIVHFDYHLGNVLVDPRHRDTVAAIIDWDGARAGSVSLDLAILAFDLSWRAPGPLQQRVEGQLLATSGAAEVPKVWAHASLRLLDWTIRHHPQDIDHWVEVASRHLGVTV